MAERGAGDRLGPAATRRKSWPGDGNRRRAGRSPSPRWPLSAFWALHVPPPLSISTSDPRARRYLATLAALVAVADGGHGHVRVPARSLSSVQAGDRRAQSVRRRGVPDPGARAALSVRRRGDRHVHQQQLPARRPGGGARVARDELLALAGSLIREQRAVLEVSLATGKGSQRLLGPRSVRVQGRPAAGFPYYLYRDTGWRTAPYFLSLGALLHGVATIRAS